jgi:hypothetical protein
MQKTTENNLLRVAVVSIGRSGTSLFARILDEVLGIDFGEESDHIRRNSNNPDGYFENAEFLEFNNRVMQAAGCWTFTPPLLDYPAYLNPSIRANLVAEATRLLAKYAGDKPTFGWKDPRLSFTLPIWREASPNVVPIIAFRKPISVLSSIGAQMDWPVNSLSGLWFRYYQHVFAYTEGLPRHVASFDQLLADPLTVTRGLAQHLKQPFDEAEVRGKLAGIVKPQQSRHSKAETSGDSGDFMLDERTLALYEYLHDCVVKNATQPATDRLRKLLLLA